MNFKAVTGIVSCAVFAMSATAGGTYTIADSNSTATFDPAAGQIDWTIDGVNQLFTQEFYFRRSTDTRELRMDSFNLNNVGNFTQNTNPFADNLDDAFGSLFTDGNGLEFETLFTLRGNAPGSSSAALAEQITIRNTSNTSMTLSFFQFVDFDLGGDAFDDAGQIINGNTAQQSDDDFILAETVATPMPSIFQMGSSFDISSMLNDSSIDTLDGTASYAGDVAWAFQWDITLAAGDSFLISKNKLIIPAPSSILLLGAAGLLSGKRRRN